MARTGARIGSRIGAASLLRNRDFVKLWWGQSVSELGSQVTQLALPLVAILTLHATPFEVGALAAAEMAPFLLVGLPAGAIVDWMRRRKVLLAADLGRMLVIGSIPITSAFGALTIGQLYAVAFVAGILTVFFDVAYQSYLPVLVDRAHITDGNAKLTSTAQVSQVAGPAVGGALVGAVGAATAMAADAASYVVSVASLVFIRHEETKPPRRDAGVSVLQALRRDMREGLRFVVRHPMLRKIAGCTGSSNLASSISFAVLTLFMVRKLHLHPAQIGGLFAAGGVAGIIGALLANRTLRRFGVGATTLGSALGFTIGAFMFPLATRGVGVIWIPIGQAFFGVNSVIYNVAQVSLRQAITPHRLLGRMNATMRFMVWGTMPIGSLIGGALGGTIGLRATLWVGAGVALSSPFFILFSPVRSLREIPDMDDVEPEIAPSPIGPVPA